MPELTTEGQAKMIADYDYLLALLANSYEHYQKLGEGSEDAVLGGVGMVLSEIVHDLSPAATLIITLAARQIATLRKANHDLKRERAS